MSIVEELKNGELDSRNPAYKEKLYTYNIFCPHCHNEAAAQATEYGMPSKCNLCSQPVWLYKKPENFSLEMFLKNVMIVNKISLFTGISQVAAQLICGIMLFFMDAKIVFIVFLVWSLINFITVLYQLIFLSIENKMGWTLVPRWLATPFSSYVETTTTRVDLIPIYGTSKNVTKYKYEILQYLFKVMAGKEAIAEKPNEGFPIYSNAALFFLNALCVSVVIMFFQGNVLGILWTLVLMAILMLLFVAIIYSLDVEHNDFAINASVIASMLPEKITLRKDPENE